MRQTKMVGCEPELHNKGSLSLYTQKLHDVSHRPGSDILPFKRLIDAYSYNYCIY